MISGVKRTRSKPQKTASRKIPRFYNRDTFFLIELLLIYFFYYLPAGVFYFMSDHTPLFFSQ